jgi:hypothetical protein
MLDRTTFLRVSSVTTARIRDPRFDPIRSVAQPGSSRAALQFSVLLHDNLGEFMKSLTRFSLGAAIYAVASVGLVGTSVAGSTTLSLDLNNGPLQTGLGTGDSIRFTRPQQATSSVLVARTVEPVLCSQFGNPVPISAPAVVVDPNGYLPPYNVGGRNGEPVLELAGFPDGAMFRTSSRLAFDDLLYPVPPNFAVISDVAATCAVGLAQPTVVEASPCDVLPDSFEADRINRGDFERSGDLALSSRIIDSTPTSIYYEHVVRAVGGAVSGVRLREQFPHRLNQPGQARFKDSLVIDSAWVCRASEGAQCSSSSLSDAGLGYAHLDTASLDAGACLRVIAMRASDSTGALADDFSGSLHGALFYPAHNQAGAPEVAIEQSRFDFD